MGGPSSGMFKAAAAAAVHRTHPPMGGAAGTARLAVAEWTTSRSGGRVEAEDDDGPRWASRWLVSGHARVECHSVSPRPSAPEDASSRAAASGCCTPTRPVQPRTTPMHTQRPPRPPLCAVSLSRRCLHKAKFKPKGCVLSMYQNSIISDDAEPHGNGSPCPHGVACPSQGVSLISPCAQTTCMQPCVNRAKAWATEG